MFAELWVLLVMYVVLAAIVGRRAWRDTRISSTAGRTALAVAAGTLWPITLSFWQLEWLVPGTRDWDGHRRRG